MIELIFAIVVIGIALMSAPNLIRTSTKSGYVAIQQEAINEAASHLNMVIGYHWDENDTDDRYLDPILHVSNGDWQLDENKSIGYSGRRYGTPTRGARTFIRADGNDSLTASSLGLDAGETRGDEDDIDDFDGSSYSLEQVVNATADYVEKSTVTINTTVRYYPDIPDAGTYINPNAATPRTLEFDFNDSISAAPTTNIKKIEVTLISTSGVSELQKNIKLRAFSCNIGAVELKERDF